MLGKVQKNLFLPGFPVEASAASAAARGGLAARIPAGYGRRRPWRRELSVTAAFRRVPMETAGAYRLVDEDSGENFIVWGGADGPEAPMPSNEVLSWKPMGQNGQGGGAMIETGSLGSFGRLKASKVKALMKKSFQASQERFHKSNRNTMKVDYMDMANIKMEEHIIAKNLGGSVAHVPEIATITSPLRRWKAVDSTKGNDAARKKQHNKLTNDSGFFSRKSFQDLGCADFIIESLEQQSIISPSHIQAMAYGPVLEGKSCIIADQSGSGKTIAYLAPVVQRLRREEMLGVSESLSRRPRVVVLAPTAELASQVLQNCRFMAKHGVPFRSVVATGGFRQKTQLDSLQQELDVIIATPGRFRYLLQEGNLQLSNLKSIILDEVDILFSDEEFEQVLQNLIRSAPMATQYLFVTATLPVDIYNKLIGMFPDCEVVMGPRIHRTSSRLDEIETCRKVENALRRFDRKEVRLKALPFHAALTQELRLSNMEEFLKSQTKESMFLICTDRASRGIDFPNVDHVVLFDFPRDPSEYVRRVGRTARGARQRGKAFVFVVGKQVSLAKRIIERNKKGHPLHDVPNAYELQN
ncbi:DEAD-box ATP-dependent RNA helicase 50 [Apostasia shenzhenica]|uniref:DEAD-box ATP-dependent RNA helicase 50 n=1 Tax=Apostasia shenzhenica TaxID=1088818 RepID=A0A2I0AAV9_9ASPA|nr:DEAD-box ATP-dependent RNA helicase 50 [Apostasia shenzhenica]